jgi:hypothetical protein
VAQRSAIAGILVAAVAFGVSALAWRGCAERNATSVATAPGDMPAHATGDTTAVPHAGSSARVVPKHPVKLASASERAAVAEAIAQTNAARAAYHSAPAAPHLPDEPDPPLELPPGVMDTLREAVPFLADCYRASDFKGDRTARVRFGLTSSPEVGTLIDPDQLRDGDDKPLDAGLEECLRGTLESLELPPLGSDGITAKIEASFDVDPK